MQSIAPKNRLAACAKFCLKRVLLLGDYRLLLTALKRGLEEEGFTAEIACQSLAASDALLTAAYDAIVIDVRRPGMESLALVRRLRQIGMHAPILVLAPPDNGTGTINDCCSGIDDWLTKPFTSEEFLDRVRALI